MGNFLSAVAKRIRLRARLSGRSRVQAIYGAGRGAMFQREIMGQIVGDGDNMAFRADKLKRWFEKAPLSGPYDTNDRTIYIAVDPNGGASGSDGPGSDTAIVSFIVVGGRVTVSATAAVAVAKSARALLLLTRPTNFSATRALAHVHTPPDCRSGHAPDDDARAAALHAVRAH